MATEYAEKRDFFRMNMDCTMEYSINGSGIKECGTIKDLSGDGVSFLANQEVSPGTEVSISITPENTVTPPLNVKIEVLRCDPEGGNYLIAGNITAR